MLRNYLATVVAVLLAGFVASAQAPPRFEVASVKTANPADPIFGLRIQPGRFSVTNATLEMLVGFAYALPNVQVSGLPKWAQSESFTVEATVDPATPLPAGNEGMSQAMRMLQSLLADRFRLAAHKETRQAPVYELAVANSGTKLNKSAEGKPPGRRMGRGQLTGSMPMGLLATSLSQWVDRPVIDKTGLTGNYDVELTYSPDVGQGARFAATGAEAQAVTSDGPSLFSALREQLGLELRSARGPVEILVVDRCDKPENN